MTFHEFGTGRRTLGSRIRGLLGRRSSAPEWRPSPEWLADMERAQAIGPSPLIRVVAVGQTEMAAEVTVDLLAIECREGGAILHWRARWARDVLLRPDVSVADERGTQYRVIQGGGGGGSGSWQGETLLIPTPPIGTRLTIGIASFGPHPDLRPIPRSPTDRVVGPWNFTVELR